MSTLDIPDELYNCPTYATVDRCVAQAVAAFLDDLAANYPAAVFTPDGTSKDAIAGTALRTVLTAQAKALRGEA